MGFAVILSTLHQIVFSLMHSRKCFFLLIYSCSQKKQKTKKTHSKKRALPLCYIFTRRGQFYCFY